MQSITPCLWFDDQAEEAVQFYTSIFDRARISTISHYVEAGQDIHGMPAGSVMTMSFELAGQPFIALNGGPSFRFNQAISFQVVCESQQEIDYYWEKLSAGGDEAAQQCGWLKDCYGMSWQIVPAVLGELLGGTDPSRSQRVMAALLQMKKLDLGALRHAHAGA